MIMEIKQRRTFWGLTFDLDIDGSTMYVCHWTEDAVNKGLKAWPMAEWGPTFEENANYYICEHEKE